MASIWPYSAPHRVSCICRDLRFNNFPGLIVTVETVVNKVQGVEHLLAVCRGEMCMCSNWSNLENVFAVIRVKHYKLFILFCQISPVV